MLELFSMRQPTYFSVWLLVYFVFFYLVSKSILGKNHWPVTLTCFFFQTTYYIIKNFDSNALPFTIVCAIAAIVIFIFTLAKKKIKPFAFIGSIIGTLILALIVGIIVDMSLMLMIVNKYSLSFEGLEAHQNYKIIYYFSLCLITIFGLLFSGIIRVLKAKRTDTVQISLKYIFFFWIPITHLLSFILSFYLILEGGLERSSPSAYLISIFLLFSLTIDFAIFLIIEKFEKTETENKIYEEKLLKSELDYQKIVLLNENKKEIGKIRHDILNILSTASGFIEMNKNDKALAMLQRVTEDLNSTKGFSSSTNDTLNTILAVKINQAEKDNIKLRINIEETAAILVDDYSLCRIVGNLLDNALKAVKQIEERTVDFTIKVSPEEIVILTENHFDAAAHMGKPGREGKGKNIIAEIAKKYNGKYTFETVGDVYKTSTVIDNKAADTN